MPSCGPSLAQSFPCKHSIFRLSLVTQRLTFPPCSFTTQMYDALGIHWASSIPAFLALACVPLPFLFYRHGATIRKRCKFAAEADKFVQDMRDNDDEQQSDIDNQPSDGSAYASSDADKEEFDEKDAPARARELRREPEAQREQEAFDYSYEENAHEHAARTAPGRFTAIRPSGMGALSRTQTSQSGRSVISIRSGRYLHNPYDIDRVNTRESFSGRVSRTNSGLNTRSVTPIGTAQ